MFNRSNIIVGLEIGTSKVCAAVGELSADQTLSIVGLGQSVSRGVRKGEIVDPEKAAEDVRNAVVEAEQMADVEVRSVFLGATGAHVRGFNNRGVHTIVSNDRSITEDDAQDAVKNARAINVQSDQQVIHVIRQHFRVDGHDAVVNPVGMCGARLEVDVHVVHGNLNRFENSVRVVNALQIEVEEIAFTGMAASLALLSSEQKELGALVIDIGGGTTEYTVCLNGIIKHTGVLAVGGDHISNDLAFGLKSPLGRAERLKIDHGSAWVDEESHGRVVMLPSEVGLPPRTVNLEHLQRIMSVRVEELLELVCEEVGRAGLQPYLRAGVLLCGGGARIPGIAKLAERIFGLPVAVGRTVNIHGLNSALDQPEFAAVLGLVKYGSFQSQRRLPKSRGEAIRQRLARMFGAV